MSEPDGSQSSFFEARVYSEVEISQHDLHMVGGEGVLALSHHVRSRVLLVSLGEDVGEYLAGLLSPLFLLLRARLKMAVY